MPKRRLGDLDGGSKGSNKRRKVDKEKEKV